MPDSAELVRIQWEAGEMVADPTFWGCAGCKALFPYEEALKAHVKRESETADELRRLRNTLRRLIDGRDS